MSTAGISTLRMQISFIRYARVKQSHLFRLKKEIKKELKANWTRLAMDRKAPCRMALDRF